MDYSTWTADLKSRGYNTTGLSAGEANFADYANALSGEVKAKIAQNGQTDADKQLQAYVASLFGGKSVMQASDLMKLARSKGLKVSTSYVKTTYIMDEKNAASPGKGTKRVKTGSVAIYEITDAKGGKLVIADANGNAAIEMEEVFLNEILSGVTSDIAGGGVGSENDAKIEALKVKNEEFKKQIDELQEQYEKEIADTESKIEEEKAAIASETAAIIAAWEQKVEADPSKVYDMNSELQSVLSTRNANIARYETELNNNATMATMQNLITNALKSESELSTMNGYKAQQMPGTISSAEKYNQQMKENAKQSANLSATVLSTTISNSENVRSASNNAEDENIGAKNRYDAEVAAQEAAEAAEIAAQEAQEAALAQKKLEEEEAQKAAA